MLDILRNPIRPRLTLAAAGVLTASLALTACSGSEQTTKQPEAQTSQPQPDEPAPQSPSPTPTPIDKDKSVYLNLFRDSDDPSYELAIEPYHDGKVFVIAIAGLLGVGYEFSCEGGELLQMHSQKPNELYTYGQHPACRDGKLTADDHLFEKFQNKVNIPRDTQDPSYIPPRPALEV